MFRKILIIAMFATAAGYCFASDTGLPQIVTSEVFYKEDRQATAEPAYGAHAHYAQEKAEYVEQQPAVVPVWPVTGSDADVEVSCNGGASCMKKQADNIKIVSKIGADLVVENNFNLGARGEFGGWSGGANMLHGSQVPMGFDDECFVGSEMPLLHREMLEDDGGEILAASRSTRKKCAGRGNYAGLGASSAAEKNNAVSEKGAAAQSGEIAVDESADAEAPKELQDQVRSWVVASGQTLREVLQNWCDKEGWDLVWATSREYPIEASAVFKGRFVDVSSALVRNFGRATPIPYAKFYKGNRVLVISTTEE
ncbi:MAG: toxin co-regulated pilus biosynthesis Q family protein [Rickettsiales bacterium]|jgi:hypothetical protein|nr:toxin co-regulated pilus biosynthesis Q family protein [Rickettsiales bacterium]